MIRQSKALLAAAVLAVGFSGCFDDPTSSLRNGPVALTLTSRTITLTFGDSTTVQGVVIDEQGNPQAVTGASWTSSDPSVAVVREDATEIPGHAFTRAFIRGASNGAGVVTVTLTANGVTDSLRVTVLPKTFPGTVSITGTAVPDTIINVPPPPAAPDTTIFSAGDTIQIDATASVTFDATSSVITLGPSATTLISRTATQIVAIATAPYVGKAKVSKMIYAGTAQTGPIVVNNLETGTIQVVRNRFRFAPTIATAASAFGANTQMTITAPATHAFAANSAVLFGTANAIVLSRLPAGTITVISPAAYTGPVTVTNVTYGAVVLTLRSAANATINASNFPGTVTSAGGLVDVITIRGNGNATFTTAGAAASVVTINGVAAWVVQRTADSIKVVAKLPGTAAVSISNVIVAGPTTIPSLLTAAPLAVGPATNEPNEPANDANGAVDISAGILASTAGNPLVIFGAVDDGVDIDDFYTFTLPAGGTVDVVVEFIGTGGGGSTNPDIDLLIGTGYFAGFPFGFAGATGAQPEHHAITAAAGTTYEIIVEAWDTGGATFPYRLVIHP